MLNEKVLEDLIVQKLESAGFIIDGNPLSYARILAKAIAESVVQHIKSNAVVNTSDGATGTIQ
jgi:AICAR transformylase/IMP cyclohydrolase PurH